MASEAAAKAKDCSKSLRLNIFGEWESRLLYVTITRPGSIDPCQVKRRALDLSGDALNSLKILFLSTPDSQPAANFGICDDPDYFTLKGV